MELGRQCHGIGVSVVSVIGSHEDSVGPNAVLDAVDTIAENIEDYKSIIREWVEQHLAEDDEDRNGDNL